jgi:hypothetical protein
VLATCYVRLISTYGQELDVDWAKDKRRAAIRDQSRLAAETTPLAGQSWRPAPRPRFKKLQGQWVVYGVHATLSASQRTSEKLKVFRRGESCELVAVGEVSEPFSVYQWEMAYASIGDRQLPTLARRAWDSSEKALAERIADGRHERRERARERARTAGVTCGVPHGTHQSTS